jgi:hypothetical protein
MIHQYDVGSIDDTENLDFSYLLYMPNISANSQTFRGSTGDSLLLNPGYNNSTHCFK